MNETIVSLFIKNKDDLHDLKVRENYGLLSSTTGIIANIILFIAKFVIGSLTNSIAITSDAFNNLSDMGSAIFTFVGYKLAAKPADDEHPFGHGRIEYLLSFVIAAIILYVGLEFLLSSIDKIRNPEPIMYSTVALIVVMLSIGVKIWLSSFNYYLAKKTGSTTMYATAQDAKNDVLASSATVVSLVVASFSDIPVDGVMGCFVSIFILKAGYGIIKDTVDTLIGMKADPQLTKTIKDFALQSPSVIGIHDLMVHNYGPGRMFASLHAEIPSTCDLMEVHEEMDRLEKRIKEETHVVTVIHMDPVVLHDEKRNEIMKMVVDSLHEIDQELHLHDFRMVDGVERINVIFDLVKTHTCKLKDKELVLLLQEKVRKKDERVHCIIEVEHEFS